MNLEKVLFIRILMSMNQSKSKTMKNSTSPFVFVSIFYGQEKWHELLSIIHAALVKQPEASPYLFFSSHRGSNIRLALKFNDPDVKYTYEEIVNPISAYLKQNPSAPHPLQLPITGFFQDFPPNEVKFNLYNERVIAPGTLSQFQLVLSQLMLIFFEDHAIDDDALFTLVVFLQNAILNGLCDTEESKSHLISGLVSALEKREVDSHFELFELEYFERPCETPGIKDRADIDHLFFQFKSATTMLNEMTQNPAGTYFIIHKIVREHLFKLPNEIFIDSLKYVKESIQQKIDDSVVQFCDSGPTQANH